MIRHIKTMTKKQWQTVWNRNTKTATALRRIMKGRHAKTGPSLYNEIINKHGAAMIAQLRTGHCGLNRYLHRFSLRNSSYYQCGYGKETVEYYLLECRNHRDQRKKLRREVGRGKMRMEALLGDPKIIGIYQGNRWAECRMMAEVMGSTIAESRICRPQGKGEQTQEVDKHEEVHADM
jgi:hypothetical protein